MADAALDLLVGGRSYAGWKEARVQLSMEHCAGGFRLRVSERWAGQADDRAIPAGDRCELRVDGETVITGYVDSTECSIDAKAHDVEVSGRDATGDLVDCSAVRKAGQWRGLRIEQIAAELAAPYGVAVRADVDTGKALASFALQEGESVFDAIERAARIRALLLVSDSKGGLLITRAGTSRVAMPLVLGVNILAAKAGLDMRERFSSYTVKGQAPGSDFFNGPAVSQIKAQAVDPAVQRHRPLIVTNDTPDVAATLVQRAQWEAKVRAAKSVEVEVTVQGWRHPAGLWRPNALVRVVAAPLRLDHDLLITACAFNLDDKGSTTVLKLTRADAYTLLPMTAPGAGAAGFWTLPKPQGTGATP